MPNTIHADGNVMQIKTLKPVKLLEIFILSVTCVSFIGGKNDKKINKEVKDIYDCNYDKITFDLNEISDDGTIGPPGGKTILEYEFCIPAKEQYIQEIKKISSEIKFSRGQMGGVRCSKKEILCQGNTLNKNFRTILCNLSKLEYINRISVCYYE